MMSLLLLGATSAGAQGTDQCRPTRPEQPVASEDNNPGLGRVLGLNDDSEDVRPFGRNYSQLVREFARNGQPGDASYLGTQVGNDCARAEEDDE
jgi:hypothetical protein